MDHAQILNHLEGSEFFKGLEQGGVEKIARLCEERQYEAGEYIFQQGDLGEYIFVIIQGYVFLERTISLGARKGRAIIGGMVKGRVIGCWSTLIGHSHHHMSSALCQKPTTVLAIKGMNLRDIMLGNIQFGFNVLERLCFSLRERIQAAYGALDKI